jgi:hypothetical protein
LRTRRIGVIQDPDDRNGCTSTHETAADGKIKELSAWRDASFSFTRKNLKALRADASNTRDKRVAVVYENGLFALFDAGTGQVVEKRMLFAGGKADTFEVSEVRFSQNGKWLVIVGLPGGRLARLDVTRPTPETTYLLNGITGAQVQSWPATSFNGFSDDDSYLKLSPTAENVPDFGWDLAQGRKRLASTPPGKVDVDVSMVRRLRSPQNPTAVGSSGNILVQLDVTLDDDKDVKLGLSVTTTCGTGGCADGSDRPGGLPATIVMLEGGEPFVYDRNKRYTGSAAAIAAARLETNGATTALSEAFKRRFHKSGNIDLLKGIPIKSTDP